MYRSALDMLFTKRARGDGSYYPHSESALKLPSDARCSAMRRGPGRVSFVATVLTAVNFLRPRTQPTSLPLGHKLNTTSADGTT
jgi:hypothetical protein